MKIKVFFICLVMLLLGVSISQMFDIPPYGDDVYPVYESGYFDELEKGFDYIKKSFLYIKMFSKKTEYAWIFLNEISKREKIDIKVFNRKGNEILAPGKKSFKVDNDVLSVINNERPKTKSTVFLNNIRSIMPVELEKKCVFCHRTNKKNKIIGAIAFKRRHNARIYYSAERIIIFLLISIVLTLILFFLFRWDPEQNIKELFDKS